MPVTIARRRVYVMSPTGPKPMLRPFLSLPVREFLATRFGIAAPVVTTEGDAGYRDVVITCSSTGRAITVSDLIKAAARLQDGRTFGDSRHRRLILGRNTWTPVKNVRDGSGYHVLEDGPTTRSLDAALTRRLIADGTIELPEDEPMPAPSPAAAAAQPTPSQFALAL